MNGRSSGKPATLGTPWGVGAIANAEWTGVKLRTLLKESGTRKLLFAAFRGADVN
jgi:sulfite oxidase